MSRPVDYNGRKLASSTLRAVIDQIEHGETDKAIQRQTSVAVNSTRKYRRNLEAWSQPHAPRCVDLGRPSTLLNIHRQRLLEYLNGRPHAYLEEVRDWILDKFGIPVSISLVY